MKTLKVILLWLLSIVFVLLIVQNTAPVRAQFLWLTADVPVILLLLFVAAVGFISGLFIGLPMKRGGHEAGQGKSPERIHRNQEAQS